MLEVRLQPAVLQQAAVQRPGPSVPSEFRGLEVSGLSRKCLGFKAFGVQGLKVSWGFGLCSSLKQRNECGEHIPKQKETARVCISTGSCILRDRERERERERERPFTGSEMLADLSV